MEQFSIIYPQRLTRAYMLCMYISKIWGDVSGILRQIIVPFHQPPPICLKLGKQRVLTKSLYSCNFQKNPLGISQIMTSQILTFCHFSKKNNSIF